MSQSFDFEKALEDLRAEKDLTGKDGVLMPLIKQLTEAKITGELEHHIATSDEPNRKNGKGSKRSRQARVVLSSMPQETELAALSHNS